MTTLPPELATTEDGSLTLFAHPFVENNHCTHGAWMVFVNIFIGVGFFIA